MKNTDFTSWLDGYINGINRELTKEDLQVIYFKLHDILHPKPIVNIELNPPVNNDFYFTELSLSPNIPFDE